MGGVKKKKKKKTLCPVLIKLNKMTLFIIRGAVTRLFMLRTLILILATHTVPDVSAQPLSSAMQKPHQTLRGMSNRELPRARM